MNLNIIIVRNFSHSNMYNLQPSGTSFPSLPLARVRVPSHAICGQHEGLAAMA